MIEQGAWDCHHCKYHLFQEGTRDDSPVAECLNEKLPHEEYLKGWDGCGDKDSEPCPGFEDD